MQTLVELRRNLWHLIVNYHVLKTISKKIFQLSPNSYSRNSQLNQLTHPIPTPNVTLKSNKHYLLPPNTHNRQKHPPKKAYNTPPSPKLTRHGCQSGEIYDEGVHRPWQTKGPGTTLLRLYSSTPPFSQRHFPPN